MAVSCGAKCAKYLLIIFNFIFWLSGAAILGVGIWFTVDEDLRHYGQVTRLVSSQPLLTIAGYILIGVGCFVFIVGFFGCCGAIRESKCMLGTYMFFLIIVLAGELLAGVLAILYRDVWLDKANDELKLTLRKEYTENPNAPFVQAMDAIQQAKKCCGVGSYEDYRGSAFYNKTDKIVPASCCIEPTNEVKCIRNKATGIMGVLGVQPSDSMTALYYPNGCSAALIKWFNEHSIIIIGVGIGIACLELFGLIFAICLCRGVGEPLMLDEYK